MASLLVQVTQCIDDSSYPTVVAVQFTDAESIQHVIVEKVPVLGLPDDLRAGPQYPVLAKIDCEVLGRFPDTSGRIRLRISIAKPWGLESVAGQTEFVVYETQIADLSLSE